MDNEFFENLDRKDFITYAKEAIGQAPLEIKLKKLDKNAVIPQYAHDGDVGMDLTAISVEYDREHDMYIYHTGIAFETDKHYGIFLFPRSSNRKTDAYLCNHVGIADSAIYRGEIMLCFKNRTSLEVRAEIEKNRCFISRLSYEPFTTSNGDSVVFNWPNIAMDAENARNWIYDNPMQYAPYQVGERVAQMVVLPYPNVKISEREELSETERGSSGFGSTGS
jgi:dUTP pyrophosphatase